MYKIMFWFFLLSMIAFNFYIYKSDMYSEKDMIKIIIASTAIISIIIAIYQIEIRDKWNRQHSAMIESERTRDKYEQAIHNLDSSLEYIERKDAYSLETIHKYLCGEEDHKKNPAITAEGTKIRNDIFIILNYYEYLAVGIKNKVFDEKIIIDLAKGPMQKAQKLFGNYTEHLREKHTKDEKQFIELENIVNKWNERTWFKKFFS